VITRAGEQLGWSPEIALEEGLKHTIAWFTDRSESPDRASLRASQVPVEA
jgi:dTDP-D-glucose 4,6-dehydratase